jgi:regulator of replication initiation timing
MEASEQADKLAQLEQQLSTLNTQLGQAQAGVQQWVDAGSQLSIQAAKARAENQGAGRGFFASLLGSGYRSAARRVAASSNAAISKEVAEKREAIAHQKRQAQDLVRQIKEAIKETKDEIKALTATQTPKVRVRLAPPQSADVSIEERLRTLIELKDKGLIEQSEYETRRAEILSSI